MRIASSRTEIHDRHGHSPVFGASHESIAREHGQRRPHHQQRFGRFDHPIRRGHGGPRDRTTEEHDARLERTAAASAWRNVKRSHGVRIQVDVTIGRDPEHVCIESRISLHHPHLHGRACFERAASQAHDFVQRPVQLERIGPRGMVQPVNVLRDESGDDARILQLADRTMTGVGERGCEARPTSRRASPIPPTRRFALGELAMLDRVARLLPRLRSAIVRDARVGADAGARENRDSAPAKKGHQSGELRILLGHGTEATAGRGRSPPTARNTTPSAAQPRSPTHLQRARASYPRAATLAPTDAKACSPKECSESPRVLSLELAAAEIAPDGVIAFETHPGNSQLIEADDVIEQIRITVTDANDAPILGMGSTGLRALGRRWR